MGVSEGKAQFLQWPGLTASRGREIAAGIAEMATNITGIGIDSPEIATRSLEMVTNSRDLRFNNQEINILRMFAPQCKALAFDSERKDSAVHSKLREPLGFTIDSIVNPVGGG